MKHVMTIFLLVLASCVAAQTKQEKALNIAIKTLHKAMVDADTKALESIITDKLSYGHSGGHVENKTEFIEKIVSGKSDFVKIDITEQTISVSKDIAIVRHLLTANTNDNGKPGTVHLRILLIWQKEKGKWKLLARQAVKFA